MALSEQEQLTEAINNLTKQLKGGGGGSSLGGLGGGGFSRSPIGGLSTAVGTATDAIDKLGSGTMTTKDALGMFNKALSNYGGEFGKMLSTVSSKISEAMLTTNKNLNAASDYGATFNNNIAEFDYLIKGARMTQDEYTEMVKKGAAELGALGSTVNRAQKNFLEMTEALHQRPIIAQLEKLGMTAEEVNKAMYVASLGQPGYNANDPLMRQRQVDATEQLINSIDENSRITGIGRKEQLEKLQQQKVEGHYIAAQQTMTDAQKSALHAVEPLINSMGPAMQTVFKQMVTSGAITNAAGTKAAATLGITGGQKEIMDAALAVRNAKTAEDTGKAKALVDAAVAAQAKQMTNKNIAGLSAMDLGDKGGAQSEAYKEYESAYFQKIQAKIAEAKTSGENIDEQEALRRMRAEVKNEQAGLDKEGKPPTDPAIKTATTINEIDRDLKAAAGGMSIAFGEATRGVGKFIGSLDEADAALKNRSQKGWEALGKDFLNYVDKQIESVIKLTPKDFQDRLYQGKELKKDSNPREEAKDLEKNENGEIVPKTSSAAGTPEFERFLTSGGSFDDMFHHFDPKGELGELHGDELVANKDQMRRLFEKMFPADLIKQLSTNNHLATPKLGPMNIPLPTNFGNDIADQLKPTQLGFSSSNKPEDIQKVFDHVNDQMKNVTSRLSEVADKLKNISFIPAAEQFNEQIMSVFKNMEGHLTGNITNSTHIDKAKANEAAYKQDVERAKQQQATPPATEPPKQEAPKPAETTPPVETAKVKTAAPNNTDPEAGLKDPRDEFTNSEMQELETGIQSKETLERKVREGDNKFYIDKIAEMRGRTDEDAVHDLPILEAQYAAFKPKYDAETAAAARMREMTLAAEKKQREQEASIKSKDENTVTYDPINGVKTTTAPPLTPEEENERLYGRAKIKTSNDNPENHDKYFKGWDDTIREEKNRSRELDHPAPNYSLTEPYDQDKIEPALSDGFTSLSDKLTASVSTNVIKPEENPDRLASAMETLKSPDYTAAFTNLDNKIVAPGMNEESQKQATEEARQKAMNDKLMADLESRPPPPIAEIPHTEAPPPTVTPETHGQGLWDKFTGMFESDNRPLASRGNVRYEAVQQETPEENAAKLAAANTPEEIAKRKADPNDPANIYREHVRNSGMYKHDDLWKSIVKEDSYKKPAESAKSADTAQAKPAAHHIGGLETWQEFNSRKDAEDVKNAHAQIKDISKNQAVPTTHDLAKSVAPAPKAPEPPAAADTKSESAPAAPAHAVSLKEIYEAVLQLNKTMSQMASHTESISSNSHKQVKVTKTMSDRTY